MRKATRQDRLELVVEQALESVACTGGNKPGSTHLGETLNAEFRLRQ
jgi:hypothetical protein